MRAFNSDQMRAVGEWVRGRNVARSAGGEAKRDADQAIDYLYYYFYYW